MNRPPVKVNLAPYFKTEARGHNAKSMIVCHETVSPNAKGITDIRGVAQFIDGEGYEIHGIIDKETNTGWAYDRRAIYDHVASGPCHVNEKGVGFELISEIPFLPTNEQRKRAWLAKDRRPQLITLARWVAWLSTVENIPLRYSPGNIPGITSHWSVSQTCLGGAGHWDCKPIHMGGHFPILYVIEKARQIRGV
jgi:hypothetical protein